MLTLSRGLDFPILFTNVDDMDSNIYKLDWSKEKFNSFRYFKLNQNDEHTHVVLHENEAFPSLPEPYDSEVKNLRFKINSDYMTEIQNQSMTALVEWSKYRPFDTMIREICLEPAIANVWVAFSLLADCIVDENSKWLRSHRKIIYKHAMSYKFWFHQTGRGLVWDKARLGAFDSFNKLTKEEFAFISDLKDHLHEFDKIIKQKTPKFREDGTIQHC